MRLSNNIWDWSMFCRGSNFAKSKTGPISWTSWEILPKQYLENVVRVDRSMDGGGVIIAAQDDYICSEVTELHTQCEIAWMKMEIDGCKPLYICGYYKPNEGDSGSLEQFEGSLRRLGVVNSHIIIAGDINFPGYDWINSCLKPNCNYPTLTY